MWFEVGWLLWTLADGYGAGGRRWKKGKADKLFDDDVLGRAS